MVTGYSMHAVEGSGIKWVGMAQSTLGGDPLVSGSYFVDRKLT